MISKHRQIPRKHRSNEYLQPYRCPVLRCYCLTLNDTASRSGSRSPLVFIATKTVIRSGKGQLPVMVHALLLLKGTIVPQNARIKTPDHKRGL